MAHTSQMPICPMAETCKGMMERPRSGLMLIVPGLILITLGVVVVFEPRILVWLIAIALITAGTGMLMLGNIMRKLGARFRNME